MFTCFDVEKLAKAAGITVNDFNRMAKEVRQEFPDDEMMFELHLMRVIKAMVPNGRNGKTAKKEG